MIIEIKLYKVVLSDDSFSSMYILKKLAWSYFKFLELIWPRIMRELYFKKANKVQKNVHYEFLLFLSFQKGDIVPLSVGVGDKVLLPEYGGTKVILEDQVWYVSSVLEMKPPTQPSVHFGQPDHGYYIVTWFQHPWGTQNFGTSW